MKNFNQTLEALETTTLRISATGQMVLYLQTALQDLGHYDGDLDGQFGPATQTALQSFQEHVGVPVTGEFDMASWYAINFWLPSLKPTVQDFKHKVSWHLKNCMKVHDALKTLIIP